MDELNWDDLRIFTAIIDAGSLRGASRALAVNHSTVFRRLNRLEKTIGARVFDRLPQSYILTAAGEELRDYALRISNEIDALQLSLRGRDFRPSGLIRVTAPDNIAYSYLPRHFATFRQRYPDIRLELVVGAESLDLSRREADIAIRATSHPPQHLVGRQVCSFAWAFYASPEYLEQNGRPHSAADLPDHRVIGGEGALAQLTPMKWTERHCGEQVVTRCNTLNAMAALVAAGLGLAVLPDDQNRPGLERLFELQPPYHSDLWILTHPELKSTERIRLLVQQLYTSLREDKALLAVQ